MVPHTPKTIRPWLALLAFMGGCSLVVDRVAGDPDDKPPFDPDGCGLWGKVYLEGPEGTVITESDPFVLEPVSGTCDMDETTPCL